MNKVILFFISLYILIPLVSLLIVRFKPSSLKVNVPEKIDIIQEDGVEYWCDSTICWRADPRA